MTELHYSEQIFLNSENNITEVDWQHLSGNPMAVVSNDILAVLTGYDLLSGDNPRLVVQLFETATDSLFAEHIILAGDDYWPGDHRFLNAPDGKVAVTSLVRDHEPGLDALFVTRLSGEDGTPETPVLVSQVDPEEEFAGVDYLSNGQFAVTTYSRSGAPAQIRTLDAAGQQIGDTVFVDASENWSFKPLASGGYAIITRQIAASGLVAEYSLQVVEPLGC